jgi:predicted DNA-binding ribbon-helix-helix protein
MMPVTSCNTSLGILIDSPLNEIDDSPLLTTYQCSNHVLSTFLRVACTRILITAALMEVLLFDILY